jgi:fumarate hydratase subunit alpha
MVRTLDKAIFDAIAESTASALKKAEIFLPEDVVGRIRLAEALEQHPVGKGELGNILENIRTAAERGVPICQDTGVPVVYLTIPDDIPLCPGIEEAVRAGIQQATGMVPLRPNVVDPLSRENTGDNTGPGMPVVHIRPGRDLTITVLPKGAGAENMSAIRMLLPSETGKIEEFVVETMLRAGGRPCPPVVLGVGIGGTFDSVAALAKEALLLPIDCMDPFEQQLCDAVNALGIGPMGLGGMTTALAVKVLSADCHTASLPVAVNVQCWACRRATLGVSR